MMFSNRLSLIQESATLKLNSLVQEMESSGVKVWNFTTGEPDFPVPDRVKKAAIQAIHDNRSKYTAVSGILPLRKKIAEYLTKSTGHEFKPSEVVVTNGGKQAIMQSLFALINPGDEVCMGSPYWVSYPEMVKIAEGTPVIIESTQEQGYVPPVSQWVKQSGPRTKMWILNSPSNPTGAICSDAYLKELGEVLMTRKELQHIWILVDDIYEKIIFDGKKFSSFLRINPGLRHRTMLVNGLSKSYCMTGWRVGWSAAPESLSKTLGVLQGQLTSNINSVAQYAALEALSLGEESFAEMVSAYQARRDMALDILHKSEKINVFVPQGAFYLFMDVSAAKRGGETDVSFCERALQEIGVALVPGGAFGKPDCVRASFAIKDEVLKEGLLRFVAWVDKTP